MAAIMRADSCSYSYIERLGTAASADCHGRDWKADLVRCFSSYLHSLAALFPAAADRPDCVVTPRPLARSK